MTFTPPSSLGGGGGLVTQGTIPWIVDGSAVVQPVSGTVTALQGTIPWDTDALTDTELRATPVPVDATITPPEGAATEDTLGQILEAVTGSSVTLALLTGQATDTDPTDLVAVDP